MTSRPALGRLANALLKARGIEWPASVVTGARLRIPHGGVGIVLHESTVVGDDVKIFQGVTIGRADQHLRPDELQPGGGVRIGNGVIIGAGAAVLFKSGQTVVLGAGSVIGANSVVVGSVPAGEIWAGVPARRVGINHNAAATR